MHCHTDTNPDGDLETNPAALLEPNSFNSEHTRIDPSPHNEAFVGSDFQPDRSGVNFNFSHESG